MYINASKSSRAMAKLRSFPIILFVLISAKLANTLSTVSEVSPSVGSLYGSAQESKQTSKTVSTQFQTFVETSILYTPTVTDSSETGAIGDSSVDHTSIASKATMSLGSSESNVEGVPSSTTILQIIASSTLPVTITKSSTLVSADILSNTYIDSLDYPPAPTSLSMSNGQSTSSQGSGSSIVSTIEDVSGQTALPQSAPSSLVAVTMMPSNLLKSTVNLPTSYMTLLASPPAASRFSVSTGQSTSSEKNWSSRVSTAEGVSGQTRILQSRVSPTLAITVMPANVLKSTGIFLPSYMTSLKSSPADSSLDLSPGDLPTSQTSFNPSITSDTLQVSQPSTDFSETPETAAMTQSTILPSSLVSILGHFSPTASSRSKTLQPWNSTSIVDLSVQSQLSPSSSSDIVKTPDFSMQDSSLSLETTAAESSPVVPLHTRSDSSGTAPSLQSSTSSSIEISTTATESPVSTGTLLGSANEVRVSPSTVSLTTAIAQMTISSAELSSIASSQGSVLPSNTPISTLAIAARVSGSGELPLTDYTSGAVLPSNTYSDIPKIESSMGPAETGSPHQVSTLSTGNTFVLSESSYSGLRSTEVSATGLNVCASPSSCGISPGLDSSISDELGATRIIMDVTVQTNSDQSELSGAASTTSTMTFTGSVVSSTSSSITVSQISGTYGGQTETTTSRITSEPLTDVHSTVPTPTTSASNNGPVTNPTPAPAPALAWPKIVIQIPIQAPAPAPAPLPAPPPLPSASPATRPTQEQQEPTEEKEDEASFLSDSKSILIYTGATFVFVGVLVVVVICVLRHYRKSQHTSGRNHAHGPSTPTLVAQYHRCPINQQGETWQL